MKKVFLSHSSADKAAYVDIIAQRLGRENIEYDQVTFEEGELTKDEIAKRIDESSVFAFFISNKALESGWVKDEVARAERNLGSSKLRKVYPIIIDPTITHEDPRIPDWLKKNYNLKLISRPAVAARRLLSKLRELHWADHPLSQARSKIFVGRNSLLDEFESRVDDVDLPRPVCVIASGINKIGRSKFLEHALWKASLVGDAFRPIKIALDRVDSIEDLLIKLYDTGIIQVDSADIQNLLDKTIEQKMVLLTTMLCDVQRAREVIFVEDAGCLVTHTKDVASWLVEACERLTDISIPVLCIAASYRVNRASLRKAKNFYFVEIPELAPRERSGLLRRLLELYEIKIEADDFRFFSEQLRGYPEEAYYCATLIADNGIEKAKSESGLLTEFNSERASLLLRQYEDSPEKLDFIYLLSEFEFIGLKFLFEIVDEQKYQPLLDDLVTRLLCDYVGGDHEYVRLNDTVRDLVRRNRFELPSEFSSKLRVHVQQFLQDTDIFERDASDFFYSIKAALVRGEVVDSRYLAPSHLLRTIKDLYFKRENLKRVVKLADMLLEKEAFLDIKVAEDARYYLCLSLARQKDRRVLAEAMKINGPEHDFVLGYYYRLCGRHDDAIKRLTKLVDTPYISSRAKRELVQVYLYIEEFDKASEMARENYEANRGNQFPIQSLLNCLLYSDNYASHRDEIERLIGELEQIGSTQSRQMAMIGKGLFEAKLNGNMTSSYSCIDDAIALDDQSPYPYLAKFDVALKFFDREGMQSALKILEAISASRTFSRNTVVKNRAYLYAATGRLDEALSAIHGGLENYPLESVTKMKDKLRKISDAARIH